MLIINHVRSTRNVCLQGYATIYRAQLALTRTAGAITPITMLGFGDWRVVK